MQRVAKRGYLNSIEHGVEIQLFTSVDQDVFGDTRIPSNLGRGNAKTLNIDMQYARGFEGIVQQKRDYATLFMQQKSIMYSICLIRCVLFHVHHLAYHIKLEIFPMYINFKSEFIHKIK